MASSIPTLATAEVIVARARSTVSSSRSSASSTAPSRDFAPASVPTGMIATTRSRVGATESGMAEC